MRRIRLAIVLRRKANRLVRRVFPQMCVKPRKSNVSQLAPSLPLAPGRAAAAKLDQAGLVGMKLQAKLLHPVSSSAARQARGVRFMLETDHEVVRIADHDAFALRMSLSPLVDPQIKHVVQEHVRKQR